jgi:hypothetical protein
MQNGSIDKLKGEDVPCQARRYLDLSDGKGGDGLLPQTTGAR